MDNNSIAAFLAAAEEGSFRKAAAKLGYTQAGISYIIQSLEEEIGLNLFSEPEPGCSYLRKAAPFCRIFADWNGTDACWSKSYKNARGWNEVPCEYKFLTALHM